METTRGGDGSRAQAGDSTRYLAEDMLAADPVQDQKSAMEGSIASRCVLSDRVFWFNSART